MISMDFGRQRVAVLACMMFASILSDCAAQTGPSVLAPNYASARTKQRKTFHYTGAKQLFTVPAGVETITITADGASGGGNGSYTGGRGGLVTATVAVTPHELLAVFVGGSGSDGGFNGGGGGIGSGEYASSAGGGASDVRVGGTGQRIVDAGGGGGVGAPSGDNTYRDRRAILTRQHQLVWLGR